VVFANEHGISAACRRAGRRSSRSGCGRNAPVAFREVHAPAALDGLDGNIEAIFFSQTRNVLHCDFVVNVHGKLARAFVDLRLRHHERLGARKTECIDSFHGMPPSLFWLTPAYTSIFHSRVWACAFARIWSAQGQTRAQWAALHPTSQVARPPNASNTCRAQG